jgi:hypothetical protein
MPAARHRPIVRLSGRSRRPRRPGAEPRKCGDPEVQAPRAEQGSASPPFHPINAAGSNRPVPRAGPGRASAFGDAGASHGACGPPGAGFPSAVGCLPTPRRTELGVSVQARGHVPAISAEQSPALPASGSPLALGAPIRAGRHYDRGHHELSAPLADAGDRRLRRLARRDAARADKRDLPPHDGRAPGCVTARRWKNEPTIALPSRGRKGLAGLNFRLFTAVAGTRSNLSGMRRASALKCRRRLNLLRSLEPKVTSRAAAGLSAQSTRSPDLCANRCLTGLRTTFLAS